MILWAVHGKAFHITIKIIKLLAPLKIGLSKKLILVLKKFFKNILNFGSGKWDRTTDLGLMSPAL